MSSLSQLNVSLRKICKAEGKWSRLLSNLVVVSQFCSYVTIPSCLSDCQQKIVDHMNEFCSLVLLTCVMLFLLEVLQDVRSATIFPHRDELVYQLLCYYIFFCISEHTFAMCLCRCICFSLQVAATHSPTPTLSSPCFKQSSILQSISI